MGEKPVLQISGVVELRSDSHLHLNSCSFSSSCFRGRAYLDHGGKRLELPAPQRSPEIQLDLPFRSP